MFASERPYRSVRALFSKSEDGWKVFPSECADEECLDSLPQKYPASVDWTIAYHGRSLGQVSTARPMKFDLYSSVGQEGITSAGTVPSVGKPSKEFAGFLAEPVLRPLVAVSQPHFADPDGWKEATLSPALTAELRKSFRARFEQVQNCTREDAGEAVPWHYSDHEIQMSQAWRSRRGWWLAEMMLTDNACDGPAADPSNDPFSPQWFTVDPQGAIKFLAGEMHFVDAGDYAGNGKSELLFSIDDYDFGGYRLFYDDFQKKAEFEFSYH
jgi:hypothetical protein